MVAARVKRKVKPSSQRGSTSARSPGPSQGAMRSQLKTKQRKVGLLKSTLVQEAAVIKALRNEKCMTKEDVSLLCERNTGYAETLLPLIGSINRKLRSSQLAVKMSRVPLVLEHSDAGSRTFIALINKARDESALKGSKLTFSEVSFFKQIVDRMVENTGTWVENAVSIMDILNIEPQKATTVIPTEGATTQSTTQNGKTFTKKDKEILVNKLHRQGWLHTHANKSGHYILGPRAFLELKPYLLKLDLSGKLSGELNDLIS